MAKEKHILESITNIGPGVREILVVAGKETIANIASSTVDEISIILTDGKSPAVTRTPEKIDGMIQSAKQLLATQQGQDTQEELPVFRVYFEHGRNDKEQKCWRALILPKTEEDEPEKWEARNGNGAYIVKFMQYRTENKTSWHTTVENSTGEPTDFTGWQPDAWWSWFASKEDLSLETTMPKSPDASDTAVTSPPATSGDRPINITQFEIVQPDRSEETVEANIAFTVDAEIDTSKTPLHYQVMVFVSDLENNESYLADVEIKLYDPEEQAITSQISFPMPALGRFQPHCFVLLLSAAGNHHAYRKGTIYTVRPPA